MPPKKEPVPWGQQPGESAPAFTAFAIYRDLGPEERSIDAVVQELNKSRALIGRWSGRWEWVRRVRAYDSYLDGIKRQARESAIAKQSRHIMTSHEVLEGISAHGDADITDLLNEKGEFDLADIKRRGLGKLIKSLTRHSNGSIARIELYDAKDAKELVGKYYRLWDRGGYSALEDDQEKARLVLAKLLKVDPRQLPPANPLDVDGELLEVDGEVARRSPKLSGTRRRHGHLQSSATEELMGDPEEVLSKSPGIPKASLASPRSDDPNDVIEVDVVDESEKRSLALARKTTALSVPVVLDANKEAKHDSEEQLESELPQTDGPSELMTPDEKTQVAVGEFKSLYSEKANGQRTNGLTGYRKLIRQWL